MMRGPSSILYGVICLYLLLCCVDAQPRARDSKESRNWRLKFNCCLQSPKDPQPKYDPKFSAPNPTDALPNFKKCAVKEKNDIKELCSDVGETWSKAYKEVIEHDSEWHKAAKITSIEHPHVQMIMDTGMGEGVASEPKSQTSTTVKDLNRAPSLINLNRAQSVKLPGAALLEDTTSLQHTSTHDRTHHRTKSRMGSRLSMYTTSDSEVSNPYQINQLWPEGIIYYTMDDSKGSDELAKARFKIRLTIAMDEWEANTCVLFVEQPNAPQGWGHVKMKVSAVNSKTDGIGATATLVELAERPRFYSGTASHELGHVLGLGHTNQRVDADGFVNYNKARCIDEMVNAQTTWSANKLQQGIPYNCLDQYIQTFKDDCKVTNMNQQVKNTGYIKTHQDETVCARYACANWWQKQYDMYPKTTFPITKDERNVETIYDYNSIMHYPIDNCMPGKKHALGKEQQWDVNVYKPGNGGRPTETDFLGVRTMYRCFAIKVKLKDLTGNALLAHKADINTMWVSSSWTVSEVKIKAARRWIIPDSWLHHEKVVTLIGGRSRPDTEKLVNNIFGGQ